MRHTLPVQLAQDLARVHPIACRACTRQDMLAAAWCGRDCGSGLEDTGVLCQHTRRATCVHERMIVDTPLYARMLQTRSAMPLWLR
jgi:hypothetical protein